MTYIEAKRNRKKLAAAAAATAEAEATADAETTAQTEATTQTEATANWSSESPQTESAS